MTTTKAGAHTAGPWHLHDMERFTVCGPDHLAIGLSNAKSRTDAENDANARLIAAAPQLKDALRELVNACINGWIAPDSPSWVRPDHNLLDYEAGFADACACFAKSSMVENARAVLRAAGEDV